MKRFFLVLIALPVLSVTVMGSGIIPGLENPKNMIVHEGRIYISDFPKIKIYETKSLRKISEFGRKGEGPGEFVTYVYFEIAGDRLVVDSQGKHSYYTLEGVFISEKKFKTGGRYKILGKNYASYGITQDGKTVWQTVNILDRNLKKIRELYRFRYFYQEQGPWEGIYITDYYKAAALTSGDKLVVSDIHDFRFSVYDEEGKLLTVIRRDYPRIPVTEQEKEKYFDFFKADPGFKPYYESHKQMIRFPSHYPPVRDYMFIQGKIYIFTYLQKKNGTEMFVFNLKGELEKKAYVNIHFLSVVDMGPAWITGNRFYQLTENQDEEEWELKISEF